MLGAYGDGPKALVPPGSVLKSQPLIQVAVVGIAVALMVLTTVGSQLLIHLNGHDKKAEVAIVVTLVGIVTDVSFVHPEKA